MTFYALHHKPSDGFLAELLHKRGYTHTEPCKDKPPRLFRHKQAAAQALNKWLAGKLEYRLVSDALIDNDTVTNHELHLALTPVATRLREEMEIVKVTIVIER